MTPMDGKPSEFLIAQAWLGMSMTIIWIFQLMYGKTRY